MFLKLYFNREQRSFSVFKKMIWTCGHLNQYKPIRTWIVSSSLDVGAESDGKALKKNYLLIFGCAGLNCSTWDLVPWPGERCKENHQNYVISVSEGAWKENFNFLSWAFQYLSTSSHKYVLHLKVSQSYLKENPHINLIEKNLGINEEKFTLYPGTQENGRLRIYILSLKKLQYFGHLMWRAWCRERLKAGGEGGNSGQDGWMASPTQWSWIWANSSRRWRTRKPGLLQSTGLQTVGQDWATEQQPQKS